MIVDVNPFVYSRPVPPEDVVDRDAEVADLLRHAVGGHYVRLYAPRKYGKTSLLTRALHDGERSEGLIGVLVDLYRVASVADVTVRLERAYAKPLRGDLRGKVESFLQRTGVGPSLGAFGISARGSGSRSAPSESARGSSSIRRATRSPRSTPCSTCRCGSRHRAGSAQSSSSTSSRTSAASTASMGCSGATSSIRARSPHTSSPARSRVSCGCCSRRRTGRSTAPRC